MKRKAIVFGILTALLLCFIWGQSMLPRSASAGESAGIMRWLKPLLDPNGRIEDDTFHHYLRKAAHFTEYAALGFCMSGLLSNLALWRRPRQLPAAFLLCIATAVIDEGIQLFADGRGAQLSDVLLDSVGALFSIAVLRLLSYLSQRNREERP